MRSVKHSVSLVTSLHRRDPYMGDGKAHLLMSSALWLKVKRALTAHIEAAMVDEIQK